MSTQAIISGMKRIFVPSLLLSGLLCLVPSVGVAGDGYRDVIRNDRPIAWWSLDESSSAVARSESGGFDAEYKAGVGNRRGVAGLAAGFAATSGRVEVTLDANQDRRIDLLRLKERSVFALHKRSHHL